MRYLNDELILISIVQTQIIYHVWYLLNIWHYFSMLLLVQTVGIIPNENHPISIWSVTSVSGDLSNIVLPIHKTQSYKLI